MQILSVSDTLPQVFPKTKSLSRIYIVFPSPAPFYWCIIKHVFWRMKESSDKRDYLWFPSELPQSLAYFPTVYLSFSLLWVCSYITCSLILSLSAFFSLPFSHFFLLFFSFILVFSLNFFISYSLLLVSLLFLPMKAPGTKATVISALISSHWG